MGNRCPSESVGKTLKILTKKWYLEILFDLFNGKKHFNEFKKDKPTLLNKTLARCLQELEENGFIEKHVDENDISNTSYSLTREGQLLNGIIYEIIVYSMESEKTSSYYNENEKENMKTHFKKILNLP